jgi:hypothetical protein
LGNGIDEKIGHNKVYLQESNSYPLEAGKTFVSSTFRQIITMSGCALGGSIATSGHYMPK